MTRLPRPRCAPGERAILHAEGDPWTGLVVRILGIDTDQLRRCRLPKKQRPLAPLGTRTATRLLSISDLF